MPFDAPIKFGLWSVIEVNISDIFGCWICAVLHFCPQQIIYNFISSGITSIKDEIKYWKQKLNQKSSSRIDREAAQTFIGVLENIDQQIRLAITTKYIYVNHLQYYL